MSNHYNVVIQLSNDGADVQKSIINQINNLVKALPGTQIELVIQSRGINLIFRNSHWEHQLKEMMKNNEVKLLACSNTMEAMQLTKEDLLPIVETVPSAVAHIVVRQKEGWSYLKAGF